MLFWAPTRAHSANTIIVHHLSIHHSNKAKQSFVSIAPILDAGPQDRLRPFDSMLITILQRSQLLMIVNSACQPICRTFDFFFEFASERHHSSASSIRTQPGTSPVFSLVLGEVRTGDRIYGLWTIRNPCYDTTQTPTHPNKICH